jgi:hypothetical protein
MTRRQVAIAVVALVLSGGLGRVASPPVAGSPGPGGALDEAQRALDRGEVDRALDAFEVASGTGPLPPAAFCRWGLAAQAAGAPLTALIRLRQCLDATPGAPDRPAVEARLAEARRTVLQDARGRSMVLTTIERRPDYGVAGERYVVRLVARDGRVTLEALAGSRPGPTVWERSGVVATPAYLDLLRDLLDGPGLAQPTPAQVFDPNAPGPRQAVTLRVAVGREEEIREALRGEAYERLRRTAEGVVEFARSAAVVE